MSSRTNSTSADKPSRIQMNLSLTLQNVARQLPDRPALSWAEGGLSYAALEAPGSRVAGALLIRHGLGPACAWRWRWRTVRNTCPRSTASGAPAGRGADNSKLHPREMAWIVGRRRGEALPREPEAGRRPLAAWFIGRRHAADHRYRHARLCGAAGGRAPVHGAGRCPGRSLALLHQRRAGRPKGAILTHRNLLFACHCYYADIDFLGPQDCILHAAPLTHGSGLYGIAHLARSANNIVLAGSFEPDAYSGH